MAALPPFAPTLPFIGADALPAERVATVTPVDTASSADMLTPDTLTLGDPLTEDALGDRSGGTADYSVDLGALGINVATTSGTVTDVTVTDTATGDATGTSVLDNSGITTVFVNTGNGVILQNTVQVNVFAAPVD